jgi:putative transposase
MARRGYATDLTDAQWAVLEPHVPAARTRGRPRRVDLRAVTDAVLYLLRTGCLWRLLPSSFPPWGTV